MLTTVLLFLAILTLLVFVHEAGHFITAKKSGATVLEFGFGFPPRMLHIHRNGTDYSINWIPLGGFVRIKGENGDSADPDSFSSLSAWKRFLTLISGVGMNLVLAFALLTILYATGAPASVDQQLPRGSVIQNQHIQVVSVVAGSAAEKVGIKEGDLVQSIDGQQLTSVSVIQSYNADHANTPETVILDRGGNTQMVTIVPEASADGGKAVWGVGLAETGIVRFPWYTALYYGLRNTFLLAWNILVALVLLFKDIIVHLRISADVTGPVGIAAMTGQVAHLGFQYLLQFAALLSINLAVVNILPFPALDGGRVAFLVFEKLRGKALNIKTEALIHNIGFSTLLILVALITVRDLQHFGGNIVTFFAHLVGL